MVVQLSTALGITSSVIKFSAPGWTLAAVFMGHVALGADDWFDALFHTFPNELEHARHIPVVSNTDSGLTVLHGLGNHFAQARSAVEHRVFRVNVKVGERVAHENAFQSKLGIRKYQHHVTLMCVSRNDFSEPECSDVGARTLAHTGVWSAHPLGDLAHLLELLLCCELLRKKCGLNAVKESLQPAD